MPIVRWIEARLLPSSPHRPRPIGRHHCHRLCRRLGLTLRLRLALVEGGHWQLPTDQKGLCPGRSGCILHMSNGTPLCLDHSNSQPI
jgi:hypothetical protein